MRHDDMLLAERVKEALSRIKCGHGQMRIPPEATDPDMVIVALRDRVEALEKALGEALELADWANHTETRRVRLEAVRDTLETKL